MSPDAIKHAAHAGLLSKEALAFFWAFDQMEAGRDVPRIKAVIEGVKATHPRTTISRAAAWRGLWKAQAEYNRQGRKP